jgi:glutamate-5-semialdehyde dehydrogenase
MSELERMVRDIGATAKKAAQTLASASGASKSQALRALADRLRDSREDIYTANAKDLDAAQVAGLDEARIDRLRVTEKTVLSMAEACEEVAAMDDPVGSLDGLEKRPNGMLVGRMRIPLGVVAMIYESRPNVTIDAGILCLKAGNGLILRGGSEAFYTNQSLARLFSEALTQAGLPGECVQLLGTTDREAVRQLLHLDEYIDVVIPRGGEGLIRAVVEEATMPVLKHYQGVCHMYVDETADLERAVSLIHNAKVQRPGVCNALECLLVQESVAKSLLPAVAERLGNDGVEFRADQASLPFLGQSAQPASESDFGCEFLDLILAVRVVADQDEAQAHIQRYGSNHTEAILTSRHEAAMRFLREVDASLVVINASTRFNDGGQLGLGAEIGISTSKLHAYGPMGVRELTSTKFVLFGQGQIREG